MKMEISKEILQFADFVDEVAEQDSDYGLREFFKIKWDVLNECSKLINRTEEINQIIPKTSKSQKGKLSYEKGPLLEKLAKVIFSIRNIYLINERVECDSNEIELLLRPSTNNSIYSRLLPDYLRSDILIECKNHSEKIDVTLLGKFYSLLRYKRVKFGIMFSYYPLTGENEWDAAVGLSKKLYLRDETIIVNVTIDDIKEILNPEGNDKNIISIIKRKVGNIKYHTNINDSILPHPAEKKMKKPS